MKHLYLVRHAKSSWKHPGLDDFDRPLNKRGMHDAPEMGKYLAEQEILPQRVVTSPARRASATAISLAASIRLPSSDVVEDGRIYAASMSTLMVVIQAWDDAWECVMMVGHDPGIADVATVLAGADVGHVPTCTVMELGLDVASWSDVAPGCGVLRFRGEPGAIRTTSSPSPDD